MREIDIMAEKAKSDETIMNDLVLKYENFILKCAASVSRNYISKNDDEWSIALAAFLEAIRAYSMDKGSFLNFAELVMRRRIIDFIRSKSRYAPEISINPNIFESDSNEDDDSVSVKIEVTEKISEQIDNSLKLEIELANEVFSSYGFTFYDLADCSPKAKKTKKSCAEAAAYMLKNPILVTNMKVSKLLPLKIIEKNAKIPRKVLERHRKYIIAAVEIISGDYPYLSEYMRSIREEFEK
ncbi:MAG: RNA polymerase sigma-I factor [Tissierellia bacterium]|nr:RNA polymerase sigma-I factor [Tissierellia bacterium]